MNRKIFIYLLVFIFIVTFVGLFPLVAGFGKTGRNTSVLGQDYSLLSKSQIISNLSQDFPLPESIPLTYQDRSFTLNLASISASVNYEKTASNLLFRRIRSGLVNYFSAFFQPKEFYLDIDYDPVSLDNQLISLSSQIDSPFVPSELSLDSKTKSIVLKDGQLGQRTEILELKNRIISTLQGHSFSVPLEIPTTQIGQLPSDSEISLAKSNATKLLGKSLEFTVPDQVVTIDDKTLVSWIDFTSLCNNDNINDYVGGLKGSLKKDPIEAVFKFENRQVLEFKPATPGYILDESGVSPLICTKLNELITSSEQKLISEFPIITTDPKTKNSDVNDLGIVELLGKGKSTFKHSSAIRNMNVQRGAEVINRILVAPGETFSFVKSLGDVSLENGYKMAYIIRAGKTELDVGGGICQVSTTFFRAMLDAGLDITERRHHAYRVGYYEEDSPPGYDATIFIPSPDLKFVNDTGHHLLIQSNYNGTDKTLEYEIYGTSDGRKTEITNYRQWGAAPPPPTIYIDDPTLPAGKVIQDERAVSGLKTSFDWKVTRNGEVLHQQTFTSSYVPWAAVFRRGTKTN